MRHPALGPALWESACAADGALRLDEVRAWLAARAAATSMSVQPVSLAALAPEWTFEAGTGDLVHRSGRFFRVAGVDVRTSFGPTPGWQQPILVQPEVGILGFLARPIGGLWHLLVQAKAEPGNVNGLQLSPTVQATRSNYSRVHGGRPTPLLDWFLEVGRGRVVVDQLQSEQGSRYLRKRNRNVVVAAPDAPLEAGDEFRWLTLGQVRALLREPNLVNMDSRTVLSGLALERPGARHDGDFGEAALASAAAPDERAEHDTAEVLAWITRLKLRYELDVRRIGLAQVEGWVVGDEVRHRLGRYFRVIGVDVRATGREVSAWSQPLVESATGGVVAFVAQRRRGVLHLLVQGRVEPGNFDGLELAPTVQCTPSNYDDPARLPPLFDLVAGAPAAWVRYDQLQSEEGGRFHHDQNRYVVVEAPPELTVEAPENYAWLTLRQLRDIVRFNNFVNIEARGLLACLL